VGQSSSMMSLEALKKELSPRINVLDLVNDKGNCVVFDIRPEEEFELMHFPDSIHVANITEIDSLLKYKGNLIVVIGKGVEGGLDMKLAKKLVRHHFPHVSVLHGGIDSLMVFAEALLEGSGTGNEKV